MGQVLHSACTGASSHRGGDGAGGGRRLAQIQVVRLRSRAVAVQVAFERQNLKPEYHISGSTRVEARPSSCDGYKDIKRRKQGYQLTSTCTAPPCCRLGNTSNRRPTDSRRLKTPPWNLLQRCWQNNPYSCRASPAGDGR